MILAGTFFPTTTYHLWSKHVLCPLRNTTNTFTLLSYPTGSTTASIWSAHNFENSSVAPTITSTTTLTHSDNWSGFDSSSVVDLSTHVSEHTGASEHSYSQHVPQERDLECRAAEQVWWLPLTVIWSSSKLTLITQQTNLTLLQLQPCLGAAVCRLPCANSNIQRCPDQKVIPLWIISICTPITNN